MGLRGIPRVLHWLYIGDKSLDERNVKYFTQLHTVGCMTGRRK